MKILLFLILFVLSIGCDSKIKTAKIEKFKLQENDSTLFLGISDIDYKDDKLLLVGRSGSLVGLYHRNGKLIRSYTPKLAYSDSLAFKGRWVNDDFEYVPISNVEEDTKNRLEPYMKNLYEDVFFLSDEEIFISAKLQAPLGRNYEIKSIAMNACGIKINLNNNNEEVNPFFHTPYGMVYSKVVINFKDKYYLQGTQKKHYKNGNYDSLVSIVEYNKDFTFNRVINMYPDELIKFGLIGTYSPLMEIVNDELVIAYESLPTISLPFSKTEFNIQRIDYHNNLRVFEKMSKMENKDSLFVQGGWHKKINFRIIDIEDKDSDIVIISSLSDTSNNSDRTYFYQKYTLDGKLLEHSKIDMSKISSKVSSMFFIGEIGRLLVFSKENENLYMHYMRI